LKHDNIYVNKGTSINNTFATSAVASKL